MRPIPLLLLAGLCCASVHADTIVSYSDSGVFSASTGSDALGFSRPSETWSLSFQADSNPAVITSGMGGVSFAFSSFSYTLDGSPVAISPTFIRFFSETNGGGWLICFSGTSVASCTDGLGTATFGWPQLYSGMSSAPTLLAGAFTTDFAAVVNSTVYSEANTTLDAVAPEPSTFLMLATAVLGFAARFVYRRSQLRLL